MFREIDINLALKILRSFPGEEKNSVSPLPNLTVPRTAALSSFTAIKAPKKSMAFALTTKTSKISPMIADDAMFPPL
jgi:hypothetical protein